MWIHSTEFGNDSSGLHWSSSFEIINEVCPDFIARVANGCTYGICLDSVVRGYPGYLQEIWILGFIKHGITREVKDDGSHGKEGGEIWYRR